MKNKVLFLLGFLSLGFFVNAQNVNFRTKAFIELRGIKADFSGWSVGYSPNDTTSAGFAVGVTRAKRNVVPFFALAQEVVVFNKLVWRFESSLRLSRDNSYSIGTGLGYQQLFAPMRRFPVSVQLMAMYEYFNYGVRVREFEQTGQDVIFNKKAFKAEKLDLFLGNRQHIIRPLLGVNIHLSSAVSIGIEGYYGFALGSQTRVSLRGKTIFPKTAGLNATDSQLDIRNDQGVSTTSWNVNNNWGVRLGLHFTPGGAY